MQLTIVIPSVELSAKQEDLLESCLSQTMPKTDYEIIVVYSSLNCRKQIRKYDNEPIQFVFLEEKNVSKARNLGVQLSKGTRVLFLDDDVVLPSKEYLASLCATVKQLPVQSIVGGGYETAWGSSLVLDASNSIANLWIISGLSPLEGAKNISRAKFLVGGALTADKNTLSEIPFPEEVSWGGEDTIFLQRAISKNMCAFYCSSLNVIHNGNSSIKKFVVRSWLSGKTVSRFQVPSIPFGKKLGLLLDHRTSRLFFQLPLVWLHFVVLTLSELFYRFPRYNHRDRKPRSHSKIRSMEKN